MSEISVHNFKWSQDSRRKILRDLCKKNLIQFIKKTKDSTFYKIHCKEGMEEYRKRFHLIKYQKKVVEPDLL